MEQWERAPTPLFNQDLVERLAEALVATGILTWWDNDLAGGVGYSREIES